MTPARHLVRSPLLLVLGAALAAQPETAAPAAAPLVVKTGQQKVAANLMRSSGAELPQVAAGEHYVLTLDAEGGWTCTAGQGAMPFLAVEAHPKELMAAFSEQVEQARGMAKAGASMAAAGSPMKPAQMAAMVDGFIDFPLQIQSLTLQIEGDDAKGWDARAELQPVAEGWFAQLVRELRPSGKGVPSLGEGTMTFAWDLDPRALQAGIQPMLGFLENLVPEDQRGALRKFTEQQLGTLDGTAAFVMEENQMRMAMGVADTAKLQALLASEEWTEMQNAFAAGMPNTEVEVEREKIGDVDVLHTVMDIGMASPFAPEGKSDSYTAVAGDMMLVGMNSGRETFKELLQRAAKGFERQKLAGALMTLQVRVADFMAMSGQPVMDGVPDTVAMRVGKKGDEVLTIDVRLR